MTQFEIDSFATASGGGGGVVSGAYQLSGIYQVSGNYAFDFAKQVSGLYVTHSGGFYAASGTAGGGGTVSGWAQASGFYVEHSGGLYQPSGVYVGASGGLYQASGIFQTSGVFQTSGLYVTHSGGFYQSSGIYLLTSGGLYQVSGIYPTSGLFALSGTTGEAGTGVSGVVHASTFLGSGNNSTTVYTLSHGLGIVPKSISVDAGSPAARGSFDVSGDASNIYVKYPVAPVSGDVRLYWIAGPTDHVNLVMGSGWVHAATFLGSGNNSTLLYTLSHGLERIPTGISVQAASPQARGDYDVSGNASGIYVTYTSPPLSGDVKLSWVAGPSTISTIVTLGSGTVHAATFLGSGNASTTIYTLSHGVGAVPQGLVVSPMSPQARGDFDVSGNASGIFVTYPVAPASGDVKLSWMAGPSTLVTISGNLVHGGEFIGSGNNSTTQYTLSHGLGLVPTTVIVKEGSPQARGLYDVSGNASGLFVTYTSPPSSGTVRLFWQAGPSSIAVINAQSGIYTITSGSTLQGDVAIQNGKILIYRDDVEGRYKSKNVFSGTITHSGFARQVIATWLNSSAIGDIEFSDQTFALESGFTGFNVKPRNRVRLGQATTILVPPDYSGNLFDINTAAGAFTKLSFEGGQILESGATSGRHWTCFYIHDNSGNGIYSNTIRNTKITNCEYGFRFVMDNSGGFINSNKFDDIQIYHPNVGILWVNDHASGFAFSDIQNSITTNTYQDVFVQAAGNTSGGFIDLIGQRNTFIDCSAWDITSAGATDARSMTINREGVRNLILGGILTPYLEDNSSGNTNMVMDAWGGSGGGVKLGVQVKTFSLDSRSGNQITFAIGNSLQLAAGEERIRHIATNTASIRNSADAGYGNMRGENFQFIVWQNQAATVSLARQTSSGIGLPGYALVSGNQLQLASTLNILQTVASGATAGSGTTLPGTPEGYIIAQQSGTTVKIPYYRN